LSWALWPVAGGGDELVNSQPHKQQGRGWGARWAGERSEMKGISPQVDRQLESMLRGKGHCHRPIGPGPALVLILLSLVRTQDVEIDRNKDFEAGGLHTALWNYCLLCVCVVLGFEFMASHWLCRLIYHLSHTSNLEPLF
jgi:hypothetical protein